MKRTATLLLALSLFQACQKNDPFTVREELSDLTEFNNYANALSMIPGASYQSHLPAYLKAVGMQDQPISDTKAAVGRVLFYDKNLSADKTVACASCHKQNNGFSDTKAFSSGIQGQSSDRNAMPIGNVANFAAHYANIKGATPLLLWDERASSAAQLSRMAMTNPHEMAMTMDQIVDQVKLQNYYPYLWRKAYGDFEVTEDRVLECLDQFVGSISSYNTIFDMALEKTSGQLSVTEAAVVQVYTGDTILTEGLPFFTPNAFRGLKIFVDHCSKCHSPIRPFQEVFQACNGLDLNYTDQGLGSLTGNPADNGVFKAPPLRNIALTAPYMHDGRFATLKEVIEFYSSGIKDHPNLHPSLRNADGSVGMKLSPLQQADLLAFLHTLTDVTLSSEEKFANPFK